VEKTKKTLICFVHFYRHNQVVYTENARFFFKKGIIPNNKYHYHIIINSPWHSTRTLPEIPKFDNVQILNGHNKGYDFAGFEQSLGSVDRDLYDRYIFINDTCRGPFLPSFIPNNMWPDLFLRDISSKVKMVGPTWFTLEKHPWLQREGVREGRMNHIQSYAYGTDRKGVEILIQNGIFNCRDRRKAKVVCNHEIRAGQCIIDAGYELKPFELAQYNNERHGDLVYQGQYFGMTHNPLELMFIKTNRINNIQVQNYTAWSLNKPN